MWAWITTAITDLEFPSHDEYEIAPLYSDLPGAGIAYTGIIALILLVRVYRNIVRQRSINIMCCSAVAV